MCKNYSFSITLGKYRRFDTYRDKLYSELSRRWLVLTPLELDKIFDRLQNSEDGYNDDFLSVQKIKGGLSVSLRW